MDLDALLDRLAAVEPTDQPCISLYVDARPDNTGRPHWGPGVGKGLGEAPPAFGARTAARAGSEAVAGRISHCLGAGQRPSAQASAVFAWEPAGPFDAVER